MPITSGNLIATSHKAVVAQDKKMQAVLTMAQKFAAFDATILIHGESGTGKEVIAKYIHQQSGRFSDPFVAINCAAIPENMLEATLFGYEKGAFTGAYQACPGKFEQAQNGTLLLDEISEMNINLQAKLLRVLQEKEVERIGGKKSISLNVRVLATTNRDLSEEIRAGRFREDLYYRLSVLPVHLPPLRERKSDILPLAEQFLESYAGHLKRAIPTLSEDAKSYLIENAWAGNVRELENTLQRVLILSSETTLYRKDFETRSA